MTNIDGDRLVRYDRCTAGKPLFMVIPPEGVTISCPIHREGHFIRGRRISLSVGEPRALRQRPVRVWGQA